MRIGLMADAYKPRVSGVTNYITLNKRALEKLGHQVYVFTFGDMDYEDDEQNVIRSPGLPLASTDMYLGFRYTRAARRLLYTMDVAHVHHPFQTGPLALRLCRPRGIPVIFTNHTRYDLYSQAYLPALPDGLSVTLLQAYLPVFCRHCDLVIAPSEGLRKIMVRWGVDQAIEVVPNGVDLAPFQAGQAPVDRHSLGFAPDDVVLAYVGRLGPEKNLPFLLRAFAGVRSAFPRAALLVVGAGPEEENLAGQVQDSGLGGRVCFTGMVPYEELPRYLAAADAFVTASVTEVHPLSVIEAMSAGLPVLGIHSPGVGDTVEDGQTGFLATHDLAVFTAKMARLVDNADLRQQMGQKARQAAEYYSIERTSKIMEIYYQTAWHQAQRKKNTLRRRIRRFLDDLNP